MKTVFPTILPLVFAVSLGCLARTGFDNDPAPPLPATAPGGEVLFPAWIPAEVRGDASGGSTNVLSLEARWLFAPPAGRPGVVAFAYSNRMDQAFVADLTSSPFDAKGGVLCFALGGDGARTALAGFPRPRIAMADGCRFATAEVHRIVYKLPASMLAAAAGSTGLLCAFVGRDPHSGLVYWAEAAPLPVPAPAQESGVCGSNEWAQLLGCWSTNGIPYGVGGPEQVLADFPEFAPSFPRAVLDATLPEAFRIEFSKRMPDVDGWDPSVLPAVTNAPDKDAPLVLAMLNVLRRSGGPSPEERAARRAVNQVLYAMSQDAQNPLLFRMHAARLFPMRIPIEEFNSRTEAHFKLLAADEIRGHGGGSYYEADRVQLRAGLTAMSTDTTPFVAGPLAGRYPEDATVGQVASIILADLEAKWAAEPPRQE